MESFSLQIELITGLMGYEHCRNETVNDNLLFEHYANRTEHQYRARYTHAHYLKKSAKVRFRILETHNIKTATHL